MRLEFHSTSQLTFNLLFSGCLISKPRPRGGRHLHGVFDTSLQSRHGVAQLPRCGAVDQLRLTVPAHGVVTQDAVCLIWFIPSY